MYILANENCPHAGIRRMR